MIHTVYDNTECEYQQACAYGKQRCPNQAAFSLAPGPDQVRTLHLPGYADEDK